MDYLKQSLEKAHLYDNLLEDITLTKKHCNGYIFDSLVYRYKLAREKMMNYDLLIDKRTTGGDKKENIRRTAERDIMRFIEILHEGLKDHD